jgi:hypothetical protein
MTQSNDPHAPRPEFRAALKEQLRRAYRTERRFEARRAAGWGRATTIVGLAAGAVFCLTVGLVLGAVTGYASAAGLGARAVPDNTGGAQRQFARARLAVARANYDAARRDFAEGKATASAVERAKAEMDTMEASVARLEVDIASGEVTQPLPIGNSLLRNPVRTAITALTCGAVAASGQGPSGQPGVPIVEVSPVAAKTSTTFGAVLGVRELSDGRLLVNDAGRRQIKVLDPSMANATVAQDSVAGKSNSYGDRPATIVRYGGDSTLLSSFNEVAMLDGTGGFAHAVAMPTYSDGVTPFAVPFRGARFADPQGRLYAQGSFRVFRGGIVSDTVDLLRANMQTREVEKIGIAHYEKGGRNRMDPPENGYRVVTTIRQPVETVDSWAVLSDGTVAIVRGRDYHVDWIAPDGTKSATTRLPFDWKRLTDEEKQHLADSAKVVWDSLMLLRNKRYELPARRSDDIPAGANVGTRSGGGMTANGQQGSLQKMISVPISEIPDYYPPIRENSAMPDLDGNLWILPTTSAQSQKGELVYDVVNPKRGLFERVRIPLGRSIAGFGKGGVIYLQSGDRANGFVLERVTLQAAR